MISLNPMTGEIEGYDSPSTSAGIGMTAMSATGIQSPLAFRMLEQSPGFIAATGFSVFRGTNTLMRGGSKPEFFSTKRESTDFFGGGKSGRSKVGRVADSVRNTVTGSPDPLFNVNMPKSPLSKRAARLGADNTKTPFLRPALRNRNFFQFTDLSGFAESKFNRYSPFSMSGIADKMVGKKLATKMGIEMTEKGNQSAIGSGLFSFISAGQKIDKMERKLIDLDSKNKLDSRRGQKLIGKLGKVDENIRTLGNMNNSLFMKGGSVRSYAPAGGVLDNIVYDKAGNARVAKGSRATLYTGSGDNMVAKTFKAGQFIPRDAQVPVYSRGASAYKEAADNVLRIGPDGRLTGQAGVRGNMMTSTMGGKVTRFMGGYARGATGSLGYGDDIMQRGVQLARGDMASAIKSAGLNIPSRFGTGTEAAAKMADEALEKGVFKTLKGGGVLKTATTKAGAKVLGARAAAMAVPGLNVVATAMFAYDLAQMGGEIIKSGINLAKDAHKSLQGSIAKPTFGMGYKDTEAAATSRSRGVMAIQNSRLNMRSLLGSEASMLAAHYG